MKRRIVLRVNGEDNELFIKPNRTLLEVLRQDLNLTGAKEACGIGACGACTVLVDGNPVHSCIALAIDVGGKEVETVEGLSQRGKLHSLQKAFMKYHAFQCGFCTPGMIMTAKALLQRNPLPTEEEVKKALSGNLCRCTGYVNIIHAIMRAAEEIRRSRVANE
ncbi:MAG: (2Fe-2S)-binding protein [Deltaproteobacteria bacterium RBG_13_47_9]|nr:MAG: (2Fe-2S)-binding protein [Deltaproteobacteria bacterium RBG_13_47_9]